MGFPGGYTLQTTRYAERHLVATDATLRYEWYTDWFLAVGVDTIRGAIQISGSDGSGYFTAQMAIQTALIRPDGAGTPAYLGSTTSVSATTGDITVTSNLAPASNAPHWFRLGIAYSSGSSTRQADVGFEASWAQMGSLIDSQQVVLTTDDVTTTNDVKILPITRWFPQRFASKIRIASQIDSIFGSGTIYYKYVAQTAAYYVAVPGAAFNGYDLNAYAAASAGESATGDIAYLATLGDSGMWMRVGVIFYLYTGYLTNAILRATVSVRT